MIAFAADVPDGSLLPMRTGREFRPRDNRRKRHSAESLKAPSSPVVVRAKPHSASHLPMAGKASSWSLSGADGIEHANTNHSRLPRWPTYDDRKQSSSKTRKSQTAGGRNGGAVFIEGALLGSGMA